MNPKEFKIGSYLQDKISKELLQVSELTEKSITFKVVNIGKLPLEKRWQAEPIPITEDVLKRLNFETYSYIGTGDFNLGGDRLVELDYPYKIRVHAYDYDTWHLTVISNPFGSIPREERVTLAPIRYVHELQDRCFAIAKIELTYKN